MIDLLLWLASIPQWVYWLVVALGMAALAYMVWAWR